VGVGASRSARYVSNRPRRKNAALPSSSSTKSTPVGRHRGAGLGGGKRRGASRTPEPAAGRDGPASESNEGVITLIRRDQPPRRARPGLAASGPLRPPGRLGRNPDVGGREKNSLKGSTCARVPLAPRPSTLRACLARRHAGLLRRRTSPTWVNEGPRLRAARVGKRPGHHGRLRIRPRTRWLMGHRAPVGWR